MNETCIDVKIHGAISNTILKIIFTLKINKSSILYYSFRNLKHDIQYYFVYYSRPKPFRVSCISVELHTS